MERIRIYGTILFFENNWKLTKTLNEIREKENQSIQRKKENSNQNKCESSKNYKFK